MRVPRIEVEALIVGYAMSRLDGRYLSARGTRTWTAAFGQAADAMQLPPASFKNLRDEFDPYFENARKGWWSRTIRAERQRVLVEFESVSDAALIELVDRILGGDHEAARPAVEAVAKAPNRVANVADRLLTGRLAEDHFIQHCEAILEMPGVQLNDLRIAAQGYDFGVHGRPELAVEVKGLRGASGGLLFTDREWSEATNRRECYVLVVVGELAATPRHSVIKNPVAHLEAQCRYEARIAASWHAPFRLF